VTRSGGHDIESASEKITRRIAELGDWRGRTLQRVRALIKDAIPAVVEEWKWASATKPGTPVWSSHGIICTGEVYKTRVKLTFARGASLNDPAGLFNASVDGRVRRAIDIHEGDEIDASAFMALVRQAAARNRTARASGVRAGRRTATRARPRPRS
jgi:hypothetical protein